MLLKKVLKSKTDVPSETAKWAVRRVASLNNATFAKSFKRENNA
jgi:hypothetical protein